MIQWREELSRISGVTEAQALMAAKALNAYPLPTQDPLHERWIFAIIIKLFQHLHEGNTCLCLEDVCGHPIFHQDSSADSEQNIDGVELPGLTKIVEIIRAWQLSYGDNAPFILEQNFLFVRRYYAYEKEVAQRILGLPPSKIPAHNETLQSLFLSLFPATSGINWQAVAAATSLTQALMIINGGPGTGKTYTVARILLLHLALNRHLQIKLCAPTGKAAQRLSESIKQALSELSSNPLVADLLEYIPQDALTLHRLIGTRSGQSLSTRNEHNPIRADLIVIDEFSMVDIALFAKTLRACQCNTRLLLIGDAAQLPAVEPGNVLFDLVNHQRPEKSAPVANFIKYLSHYSVEQIDSERYDRVVSLNKNQRSENHINDMALAIQTKDVERLCAYINQYSNSALMDDNTDELAYLTQQNKALQAIADEYAHALRKATSVEALFSAFNRFQILSPIRKGPSGVEAINQWFTAYLLHKTGQHFTKQAFHGQALIVTQNDAASGLNNGDIGLVWQDPISQSLQVYFERRDGVLLNFNINRLPRYESAFALTIHKSQGSEYDKVLLILPYEVNRVSTRELLYTALTRAKRRIEIIARKLVLTSTLNTSNKRTTYLSKWLNME